MPTPSSFPNPESAYSFSSTCPDTDEQQESLQSPPSWHPPPQPPYPLEMDANIPEDSAQHIVTEEDDVSSRSTTMSPGPQSSNSDGSGSLQDSEVLSPTVHGDQQDEPHKQTEIEEERMALMPDGPTPDEMLPTTRWRLGSRSDDSPRYSAATHKTVDDTSLRRQYGYPYDGVVDKPMTPGYGSSTRIIPQSPSSFLRPGSKFHGTQQSERQVYDVQVEIKHVDMRESYLCGYLRIQGLTEDHPTLTTYFEGEIIGPKYGFMTKHEDWGATNEVDKSHWGKFHPFKHFKRQVKKGAEPILRDVAQNEHIFMRWKEHFLVPDHRVRTINGASFEGFYYICFNQIEGVINGIYFHSKSERFQQLELKHVEDRGCFSAMEFR